MRAHRTLGLVSSISSALLFSGVMLGMPAQAGADRTSFAKRLNDRGVDSFDAENFDQALKFFRGAASFDPTPKHIFNIGQTAQILDNCPMALAAYEHYLKAALDVQASTEHLDAAQTRSETLKQECEPTAKLLSPTLMRVAKRMDKAPVATVQSSGSRASGSSSGPSFLGASITVGVQPRGTSVLAASGRFGLVKGFGPFELEPAVRASISRWQLEGVAAVVPNLGMELRGARSVGRHRPFVAVGAGVSVFDGVALESQAAIGTALPISKSLRLEFGLNAGWLFGGEGTVGPTARPVSARGITIGSFLGISGR